MVPVHVVDRAERELLEAQLIDAFLSEMHHFQNCQGPFALSHQWIIARNEDVMPMSGTKSIAWLKLRYWVHWPVGSHLKLRVLVVQSNIGRQQRGTGSARRGGLYQILQTSFLPFLLQIVMKSLQSDEPQPKGPVSYERRMTLTLQ